MNQYAVPVVWSPETRRHDPRHEVWVGVATEGTERADRVDAILDALRADGHDAGRGDAPAGRRAARRARPRAARVPAHRRRALGRRARTRDLVGQERVVPYLFPTPAMTAGLPARPAVAVHADAGRFAYDTMTLVGPGTWEAARAAVDCAVAGRRSGGRRGPAGVRAVPPAGPPRDAGRLRRLLLPQQRRGRRGHAARRQARSGSASSTSTPTRATAPPRSSTTAPTCSTARCTSTRRPAGSRTSWGTPTRPASAPGEGATRNLPLPEGTGDEPWLAAVAELAEWVAPTATHLVVSLGVDAAADDPESPLQVTARRLPRGRPAARRDRAAGRRRPGGRLPPADAGRPGRGVPRGARGRPVLTILCGRRRRTAPVTPQTHRAGRHPAARCWRGPRARRAAARAPGARRPGR